jgi:riboflavin synthase
MFSGIIEALGTVVALKDEGTNRHFTIVSPFTEELRIDQSVAHNGVCLTVVAIDGDRYTVTAVDETLRRTNLGAWKVGDQVNLERCLRLGDRLDGHMVQGHVDTTAECVLAEDLNGSWKYGFRYAHSPEHLTVSKGSISVNGVSLTVVDSAPGYFSVAIIPYTYEHTQFHLLHAGDRVNLEFDIVGKYIARYASVFAEMTK